MYTVILTSIKLTFNFWANCRTNGQRHRTKKSERCGRKTERREKKQSGAGKNRAAREKTERGEKKQNGADHVPSEPPYYSVLDSCLFLHGCQFSCLTIIYKKKNDYLIYWPCSVRIGKNRAQGL